MTSTEDAQIRGAAKSPLLGVAKSACAIDSSTMARPGFIVMAMLLFAGCGHTSSMRHSDVAKSLRHTVLDVRRSFSRSGIELETAPPNPYVPTGDTYLTATIPGSAGPSSTSPDAPNMAIPLFIDVDVYPSVAQAKVGSQTRYTVGSAGALLGVRVRNVVVRWQGYGAAPRLHAAIQALRRRLRTS
jgi:hypothetical protein